MDKYIFLLVSLFFFCSSHLNAQKTLSQGKLVYSIEIPELQMANDSGFDINQMLKNFSMTIYWNKDRSRTDVNVMNGLVHTQHFQEMKGGGIMMYYDMMGRRYKVKLKESELNQIKDQAAELPEPEIIRYSAQRKEIVGHDCYRIKIDYGVEDGPELEAYIAPALQVPIVGYGMENLNLGMLNGVPLEYTVTVNGMKVLIKAIELTTKIKSSDLEYPGGYTEKTLEEFTEEMGNFKF